MVLGFDVPAVTANTTKHTGKATLNDQDESDGEFELPDIEASSKKARLPPDAPFIMYIFSYSSDGSLFNIVDIADLAGELLLAVFTHDAYPSMCFKFSAAMDEFASEIAAEKRNSPPNFKELQKSLNVKFVMASETGEQFQVAYRRGIYLREKNVKQIVDFFDSFLGWRKRSGRDGDYPEITFNIKNCTGKDFDLSGTQYETKIIHEKIDPKKITPCPVFSVPGPTWSRRHPHVIFEKLDEKNIKLTFHGETMAFKHLFSTHKILGRYQLKDGITLPDDANDNEKRKADYVRIIKKINIESQLHKNFLVKALQHTVYYDTCFAMTWIGSYALGEPVSDFKNEVCQLANAYKCSHRSSNAKEASGKLSGCTKLGATN
jgi:hypothetical protein